MKWDEMRNASVWYARGRKRRETEEDGRKLSETKKDLTLRTGAPLCVFVSIHFNRIVKARGSLRSVILRGTL